MDLKIVVCMKQVPGTNKVEMDPVTGVLCRNTASTKINPFDLYSLEIGLSLAEIWGGNVRTISMGPSQARKVIEESICMGAAGGTVISDKRFAGADVLATSYTLAQGIRKTGDFDLVLCGKQTTDGDTAQVGPELAEHLGIPHVCNVVEIGECTKEHIHIKALQDGLLVEQTVRMPCLLCIEDGIKTPRLPSYKRKLKMDSASINILTLNDMENTDEKAYGLSGSPTQVVKMFPPEKRQERELWEDDEKILAEKLFYLLCRKKIIYNT